MPTMKFDIESVPQAMLDEMNITREGLYARVDEKERMDAAAPDVGDTAPNFTAERLTAEGRRTGATVRLSDLQSKPVGLMFGSYTCPIFRDQIDRYEDIYRELKGDRNFLCVYIREAHPEEGWRVPQNYEHGIFLSQPADLDQRAERARCCIADKNMSIPLALDSMEDSLMHLYAGSPERLYVIGTDGRIAFKSATGPYDDDEVEAWYAALKAAR